MKKIAFLAALPLALGLAACADNAPDGEDTTAMEPTATEPMDSGMTTDTTATDPMATETPMADDTAMDPAADPAMEDTAPDATETPMEDDTAM